MNLAKSLAILGYGLQAVFRERFLSQGEHTIGNASSIFTAPMMNLLWRGGTDTVYSENFGKLAEEYANTLVKQLKKTRSSREVGGVSRESGLIGSERGRPPLPQTVNFSTI